MSQLVVYGFLYLGGAAFNSVVSCSFWFGIGITFFFKMLYDLFGYLWVPSPPAEIAMDLWYPLFAIIGAGLGSILAKYPLENRSLLAGYPLLTCGMILIQWSTFWFFSFISLPWNILAFGGAFLAIWALFGAIMAYLVRDWQHLKPTKLERIGLDISIEFVPYVFKSAWDVGIYFMWTFFFFLILVLGQFGLYITVPVSLTSDILANTISAGSGGLYIVALGMYLKGRRLVL